MDCAPCQGEGQLVFFRCQKSIEHCVMCAQACTYTQTHRDTLQSEATHLSMPGPPTPTHTSGALNTTSPFVGSAQSNPPPTPSFLTFSYFPFLYKTNILEARELMK